MASDNRSAEQSDITGNDLLRHFLAAATYRAGKTLNTLLASTTNRRKETTGDET